MNPEKKEEVDRKNELLSKLILTKLRTIKKEKFDPKTIDKLSLVFRVFLLRYLNLNYEFTLEELINELNKIKIQSKLKDGIISTSNLLTEIKYEGRHISVEEFKALLKEAEKIVNLATRKVEKNPEEYEKNEELHIKKRQLSSFLHKIGLVKTEAEKKGKGLEKKKDEEDRKNKKEEEIRKNERLERLRIRHLKIIQFKKKIKKDTFNFFHNLGLFKTKGEKEQIQKQKKKQKEAEKKKKELEEKRRKREEERRDIERKNQREKRDEQERKKNIERKNHLEDERKRELKERNQRLLEEKKEEKKEENKNPNFIKCHRLLLKADEALQNGDIPTTKKLFFEARDLYINLEYSEKIKLYDDIKIRKVYDDLNNLKKRN